MVPTHAHLQRDRDRDRFHRGFQYRGGSDFVAHQRGAGHLAHRDFLDRAAEIDIDQIGALIGGDSRRLRHRHGVASRQLHRRDPSRAVHLGHRQGFLVFANHRPGGNHFRDDHAGAKGFGDAAKGKVGDTRHRRENDRYVDANPAAEIDGRECRKTVL